MLLFSINAVSKTDQGEFKAGEEVPFIVYIDFADMFGAEYLAKLYVMREGFTDVNIIKRRKIAIDKALSQDPQVKQALEKGYCLQAFSAH
ncbi:hypothetical protein IB286_07850 [Spongiibacter sp. KMU-158]|uniref:Uncharacterized protein n=1 Tax=Spongiibacter pelagi TaxID=2760804 RepID=A0A927C3R1_9GAMM|nr:hypothetical protein [Spongiibacter pelagi]MBD2858925.1 hypothetical protein [Spongiibacter pelagi]